MKFKPTMPSLPSLPSLKPALPGVKLSLGMLITSLGLAALAVLALTHSVLYLVTLKAVSEANEQSARMAAESTAHNVTNLIELLNQSLAEQAGDSKLASAVSRADPAGILLEEEHLTRTIPNAWLVRLLPENADVLDESRPPHMGFSDLNMAKTALTETTQPAFNLANSPNAHLAMARRLATGGGVILASWPAKILNAAIAEQGACGIELRQDAISLAYRGSPACKEKAAAGERSIEGTPWKIIYWLRTDVSSNIPWFAASLGSALLVMGILTFLLARLLSAHLRQDRKNLLALVDDLQSGNHLGDYPFKLAEFVGMAEEIFRLKRVIRDMRPTQAEPEFALNIVEDSSRQPPTPIDITPTQAAGQEPAPEPEAQPDSEQPPAPAFMAAQLVPAGLCPGGDIRGLVGDAITDDMIYAFGLAIGSELEARGEKYIAIARDGRLSSPDLFKPLTQGLLDSGRMVINLGQVPTPLLYYATHALNTRSGVMLTGGRNPANHNGLKIVIDGEALAEAGIQALHKRIEGSHFVSGTGRMENYNVVPEYIERVVGDTQLGCNLKIVMDCGNGVAALVAPALVRALGCEVIELFCTVDGRFPNHPADPSQPENLQALIDKVLETGADLGVAFDSDGDSLGLVDSDGTIIWPDRLMMLFAADVLSREPGADIIYDVKCTRHLPSQIVKNGGRPLMWKSGHAQIKAKMRESGAMLAGEMGGHIFFQERWFGFDDAIYACARMIEILSNTGETSAEVFAKLPDSVNTPELRVILNEGEHIELMDQLREAAQFADARVTDIDGLRVDFLDGWGIVRASPTLSALSFRFEADSEKSLAHIQQQFAALLHQVKPELELPF